MRYRLRTLLILLAVGPPVLSYTGGYFWLGEYHSVGNPPSHSLRLFKDHRHAQLFRPMAWLEGKVRRTKVFAVDYNSGVSLY